MAVRAGGQAVRLSGLGVGCQGWGPAVRDGTGWQGWGPTVRVGAGCQAVRAGGRLSGMGPAGRTGASWQGWGRLTGCGTGAGDDATPAPSGGRKMVQNLIIPSSVFHTVTGNNNSRGTSQLSHNLCGNYREECPCLHQEMLTCFSGCDLGSDVG